MGRRTWVVLLVLVAMLTRACTTHPSRGPAAVPDAAADRPRRRPAPRRGSSSASGSSAAGSTRTCSPTPPRSPRRWPRWCCPRCSGPTPPARCSWTRRSPPAPRSSPPQPFTVSYELNLEASWSTNAPIAAEDFVYLWERMRAEPGVADAAGLPADHRRSGRAPAARPSTSCSPRPYPAWQHLFSGLLPAHLLKDAPGSWVGALTQRAAGLRRAVPDRLGRPGPRRGGAGAQRPLLGHARRCSTSWCCAGSTRRRWPPGWPTATSTWRCPTASIRRPDRARWTCSPPRTAAGPAGRGGHSSGCAPTPARCADRGPGRAIAGDRSTGRRSGPRSRRRRCRPTRSGWRRPQPGYAATAPAARRTPDPVGRAAAGPGGLEPQPGAPGGGQVNGRPCGW